MPTLSRFAADELPDGFAHQIRDFVRIHWFDAFQFDVHAPAVEAEWNPVHFVMVDAPALFSHAAVVTQQVECNGETYSCGGLSGVLTYPAFRKRGYGSEVVKAASDYLLASDFEVALLWTDPERQGFYEQAGWEYHPSIKTYAGNKDAPELYDPFTMMMFLSDRAKDKRADFENYPIYIGQHGW